MKMTELLPLKVYPFSLNIVLKHINYSVEVAKMQKNESMTRC